MSYNISVHDTDYSYKNKNKYCYFCGGKVKKYKKQKCKCKEKNCELCSSNKAANIAICKNCLPDYINPKKNKKIKKLKGGK